MGLFDDIDAARSSRGSRCSVDALLPKLDEKDGSDLLRILADEDIESTAICRVLRGAGHKVSPSTLNRHRRGDCKCGQG